MKHYEETTAYKCYEFTTHCKKLRTALNRMMKIFPEISDDINDLYETYDYYNGDFNECDDTRTDGTKQNPTYRFIVEFDGEFCYICLFYYFIDCESNNDNETSTDSADGNNETSTDTKDTESDTNNETSTDTKDTESDTKDTESDTKDTESNTNTDRTTCNIKAYYDGKELSVPYSEYKCKEHAIEYIKALYENRVVPYETLFTLYYCKHVEIITIEMVIDIPDLLQYNIDDINVGLKTYYYKKVREGVERFCALIDDKHVCVVGFKYVKHTFDYTITKSKISGCYNLKKGNNNCIQKPSEIARILYYHTFAHDVMFKYWYTI